MSMKARATEAPKAVGADATYGPHSDRDGQGWGSHCMPPEAGSREERDTAMRLAAFDHVRRLTAREGILESAAIAAGFIYRGERSPLVNPQRGIFKPRDPPFLLSIRTVIPRAGARLWYDDQTQAHRQIYEGDDVLDYAFMGKDANAPENQWLRDACERKVPVIYFLGVSPG